MTVRLPYSTMVSMMMRSLAELRCRVLWMKGEQTLPTTIWQLMFLLLPLHFLEQAGALTSIRHCGGHKTMPIAKLLVMRQVLGLPTSPQVSEGTTDVC